MYGVKTCYDQIWLLVNNATFVPMKSYDLKIILFVKIFTEILQALTSIEDHSFVNLL